MNENPPNPEILLQLLLATRETNPEIVTNANSQIAQYQNNYPRELLVFTSKFLMDDSLESYVLQYSAIIISNILRPTQYISYANTNADLWLKIPQEIQSAIKQGIFRGLMFPNQILRNSCAKSLSLIARIDVPSDRYPDVFDSIFHIITNNEYGQWAKLGGLQAITELFSIHSKADSIIPSGCDPAELGSKIFTITISILQSEASEEFKLTALNTLRVTLPHFYGFIENQFELLLTVIIQLLPMGKDAFSLLVKFTKLFYHQIVPNPISIIFQEIAKYLQSNETLKIMNAINFWRRISKFEYKIWRSISSDRVFHNITKQLCSSLTSHFLKFLTGIDEIPFSEDDLPKLASNSLRQFSMIPENMPIVVNECITFFKNCIMNENWQFRGASLLALSSIISPHNEQETVSFFMELLPKLAELTNDSSLKVKCLAIQLIGEISGTFIQLIYDNGFIFNIFDLSITLLAQQHEIAAAVCLLLTSIFSQLNNITKFARSDSPDQSSSNFSTSNTMNSLGFLQINKEQKNTFLMQVFDRIGPVLIQLMERQDIFEGILLEKQYEALVELLKACPSFFTESYLIMYGIIESMLEKALTAKFPNQSCQCNMIGSLCGIIVRLTEKFKNVPPQLVDSLANISNNVINILGNLVTSNNCLNERDALIAIAGLIVNDNNKIIDPHIDKIIQVATNIYMNSPSQETIFLTSNMIADIFVKYPNHIVSFAPQILAATFSYSFNQNFLLLYQVQIFKLVGDIINIIDVSDGIYFDEIQRMLKYMKTLHIPKHETETRLYMLTSMIYVSGKVIKKYQNLELFKKNKALLFFGVKLISKEGIRDYSLNATFLLFLEEVLELPKPLFNVFCIFLRSKEINDTLNELRKNDRFKLKARQILAQISRLTK